MVQEFQVLCCFSCQTFQVHQVKKSKKWSCKLCGEKQSLVKIYGQGSGVDCRQHVQKLNMLQGEIQQAADKTARYVQFTMCHSDSKWGRVVSSSVTEGSQERFSLPPYVQKTEHSSIPLLQSNIEHKCKSVRTEKNLNTNMPQAAHGERFITSNEPSLNQSLFSQQQDHSKNVLVSPTTITAPSTLFQTDEDFDDNY
ncbi:hypothetical protein GDO86_005232 [Hymenochirus boettgeri]|uniref:MRN complex-interacting protein N-terminal domain-containing protein n=1 Tax=Hymenochirus boettgeri TaxID=247094 RepID=A0A8T2J134_9PIPI|nr:hypothetical protein GDO86_005232 [Hymenochirus boettgeri]